MCRNPSFAIYLLVVPAITLPQQYPELAFRIYSTFVEYDAARIDTMQTSSRRVPELRDSSIRACGERTL